MGVLQGGGARGDTEPARTTTAVDLLLRYLENEGATCLFGIPGGPLMPFYEAVLVRNRIRPILTRHEQGAAFMADGYARVSGRIGLCCTTTGPGATNALTGIAVARRDSVPVMLITAQIATWAFGKGAAQEGSPLGIDIVDLYKPATKASQMIVGPGNVGEMTRGLLRACLAGRPGPVHLSLPADVMKREVALELVSPERYRPQPRLFDPRAICDAAASLQRAARPAILAGYGVHISRAYHELRALADLLCAPVASTPKGKGVFPEDHRLSVGVFGLAGSPQADAVLFSPDTDLLLTVGTSLAEASTHAWDARLCKGKTLLQVDIDPMELGKNYPVDIPLVGDAQQVLRELGREVVRSEGAHAEARLQALGAIKTGTPRTVDAASMEDTSLPLKPQRVVAELRRALPDDAILFVDIGNVMAWALHYFEARRPGSFFINMGFGCMGHGVAAAIGGKLAAPAARRHIRDLAGRGASVHRWSSRDRRLVRVPATARSAPPRRSSGAGPPHRCALQSRRDPAQELSQIARQRREPATRVRSADVAQVDDRSRRVCRRVRSARSCSAALGAMKAIVCAAYGHRKSSASRGGIAMVFLR
jgi:acetolactate synthase-1/2/3 large subunit